jgi:hypothetical protein
MQTDELLEQLRRLETDLHDVGTRRDARRLAGLLHPSFVEFARSGRSFDRQAVLDEFASGGDLPAVHAQDFEVAEIDAGVALLTYRSAHVDSAGRFHRWTLRSSLWVRTQTGWQLRFHQGTPSEPPTPSRETPQ